jgi:hypothetical protein
MDDELEQICKIEEIPAHFLFKATMPNGQGGELKYSNHEAGLAPVVKLAVPITWTPGDEESELAAMTAMQQAVAVVSRATRAVFFEQYSNTWDEMTERGGYRPKVHAPEAI